MYPILFSVGPFPVTTLGVFLSIALLLGIFVVWRLTLVYDFEKEQTLDLCLFSFFGSLIASRIYFVLFNLNQFVDTTIHWDRILFFTRYPGLSFWGALFGGALTVFLLSRRYKLNVYTVLDMGIVGLFLALGIGTLGCLFGSCQYGLPVSFLGVDQIGLPDKRFPLQIFESLIYFSIFFYLWKASLKFHFSGKIFSQGLLLLGISKFFLEFFRGDKQILFGNLSFGFIFSIVLIFWSTVVFYRQGRRSIIVDLKEVLSILTNSKKRQLALSNLIKRWYTFRVNLAINFKKRHKELLKKINVKHTTPEI